MTHSLHRSTVLEMGRPDGAPREPRDYVVMIMACQGVNEEGASEGLRRGMEILLAHDPINLSDGESSIFSGATPEVLSEAIRDTSYVAAVYADPERLVDALKDLAAEDAGPSVVVTGDPGELEPLLARAGLSAHTINLSLGQAGTGPLPPEGPVRDLALMCGHGLVAPAYIRRIADRIAAGTQSPDAGAEELAALCTCGIFNVPLAARLLEGAGGDVR